MKLKFSIIIPVYNRPNEIHELLESLVTQNFSDAFEVLIIEDGSTQKCDSIVQKYQDQLNLNYFFKENSGAGDSRNFGMKNASGNYFIILDSDVILPNQYLTAVKIGLENNYTDAFGGADAAHKSFSNLQKAINYAMTSVITTGGIRGNTEAIGKFQPRSFNIGLSKKAFENTQGFSKMKNGEDIDLTFRLWENGFETQLLEEAFVFHKRRASIQQFFKQTFGFGSARPLLNRKYPKTAKLTYWFPSIFIIGLDISILLAIFQYYELFYLYCFYFLLIFLDSLFQNKNVQVAFLSILTTITQFFGYGLGFLNSIVYTKKKNN
ncbi:MAG: glycosyltransferase [Polaribacter sp.]|nr:glycosyltransferase [Polaribacter sp.]MDG2356849.1 glycosyltransferase [Polaribacter sp.]